MCLIEDKVEHQTQVKSTIQTKNLKATYRVGIWSRTMKRSKSTWALNLRYRQQNSVASIWKSNHLVYSSKLWKNISRNCQVLRHKWMFHLFCWPGSGWDFIYLLEIEEVGVGWFLCCSTHKGPEPVKFPNRNIFCRVSLVPYDTSQKQLMHWVNEP